MLRLSNRKPILNYLSNSGEKRILNFEGNWTESISIGMNWAHTYDSYI